jgi:hypothetical protein
MDLDPVRYGANRKAHVFLGEKKKGEFSSMYCCRRLLFFLVLEFERDLTNRK